MLPEILEILLKCRKDVRAEQKKTKDKQKWKVLEGQQLAYMVSRGQLGHDAAIFVMELNLRVHAVREQAGSGVVDRDASFIA